MNKLILLLPLFLIGCAATPTTEVIYRNQQIVCQGDWPTPFDTNFLPVIWVSAVDREGNEVLGLDGENYTNLSINTRSTIEYIRSQKAYIAYYRGCIERHNAQ
jgi:hypothetical protein